MTTEPTIQASPFAGGNFIELTFELGKLTHGFALDPQYARKLAAQLIASAEDIEAATDHAIL